MSAGEQASEGPCSGASEPATSTAPRPAFERFLAAVDACLDEAYPDGGDCGADLGCGRQVMQRLTELLTEPDLLLPTERVGSTDCYQRHFMHHDPAGRYCVLSLVWEPGQQSPVHGHTAWCAVGVYEGRATECAYELRDGEPAEVRTTDHAPGSVLLSRPGEGGIHRVANQSEQTLHTIHVYGCDLRADAGAINILFPNAIAGE